MAYGAGRFVVYGGLAGRPAPPGENVLSGTFLSRFDTEAEALALADEMEPRLRAGGLVHVWEHVTKTACRTVRRVEVPACEQRG